MWMWLMRGAAGRELTTTPVDRGGYAGRPPGPTVRYDLRFYTTCARPARKDYGAVGSPVNRRGALQLGPYPPRDPVLPAGGGRMGGVHHCRLVTSLGAGSFRRAGRAGGGVGGARRCRTGWISAGACWWWRPDDFSRAGHQYRAHGVNNNWRGVVVIIRQPVLLPRWSGTGQPARHSS